VTGFLNSIIRATLGTILSLLVYGLTAYPLSKRRLPGVKILTWIFVFTMLFDGGIIPNYILIRNLGLMNTRFALIVQGVVSAFNIIIMRNFFFSLPESLEESAKIEGAGDLTIFFRIVVPLSKPVMATIGLWVAVWHWNNWFDAMIYITDRSKQILQIILREILINNSGEMMNEMRMMSNLDFQMLQLRAAVIIISVVPVMLIYPFIQRYFIKGIMLGSVKG
jgi:putative aldouronate transport system permease protein